MKAEDIQKMIADALGKEAAERAAESAAKAREANEAEGVKPEVLLAKADKPKLSVADPRGLDFARMVMCHAAAHRNHTHPATEAKRMGYTTVQKALTESVFEDGGSLVRDQVSADFIELLRSALAVRGLVREVQFKGSLTIGRQNGAATAAWVGEGDNIATSQPSFGELQLQAKKLAALVPLSNDLLRNPSTGIEALVRDDILAVMARKLDLALLEGSGAAHEPRGMNLWVHTDNQFADTGTDAENMIADLAKAIRLVDAANVTMVNPAFIMHPRTRWAIAAAMNSVSGDHPFLDEMSRGSILGIPVRTTSGMTASGSDYKIYFAAWGHGVLGIDLETQVEVMPNAAYYDGSAIRSGVSRDESVVRAIGRFDFVLRHDKAGSIITGVGY